jgi:hypothetical protein
MWETCQIYDGGASLSNYKNTRCCVPWLVGEYDAGVNAAVGDEGEVEGGCAEHTNAFNISRKAFGDGEASFILLLRMRASSVIADGDNRAAEITGSAGMDRPAVAERASPLDGVVVQIQERGSNDANNRFATMNKGKLCCAERNAVGEVGRTVNGVKSPDKVCALV